MDSVDATERFIFTLVREVATLHKHHWHGNITIQNVDYTDSSGTLVLANPAPAPVCQRARDVGDTATVVSTVCKRVGYWTLTLSWLLTWMSMEDVRLRASAEEALVTWLGRAPHRAIKTDDRTPRSRSP